MTYPPGGGQWRRPPPPPPPPRKPGGGPGTTVAIVLAAIAAVLVVSLVGILAVNALSVPATLGSPSTYTPPPASSTYSVPITTTPTTTTPMPSTTSSWPSAPSTTIPAPPAVPRATQPPPPPQPKPVYALGDNPLFGDFGLPKVQCSWPAYQADLASQRAHFTAVFACLDKAWAPVLAARNLPFTPPLVFIFDQPMTEQGCGNDLIQPDQVAFHCDGAIYIPARYFPDVEHIRPESFDVFIEMAAHEYGHYVLNLSGVLDAYHSQRQAAGENSAQGLLLSRRAELQAQCFSGMFFAAALGPQDFHDAKVDANLRGDYEGKGHRDDHGTPERSGAWFSQGGTKNRTAACNTWPVPADWVE